MPYNEFGETPEQERQRRTETWITLGLTVLGVSFVFAMLLCI